MHNDYDSFERLATGISDSEKQRILEQLKNSSQKHEDEEMTPIEMSGDFDYVPFADKIRHESFFLRVYIWLKSIISSTAQENIFNEYKLSLISKNITKNYPGIINPKKKIILASFYNKLNELKSAAQFIKPIVSQVDEDEGAFYVILGSLVIPEIDSQLKSDTNPYLNPVTSSCRPEFRPDLLRKMDSIFDSLTQVDRKKMYEAAKAAEWLRQFAKVPFDRLISLFESNSDEIYFCPYIKIKNEIPLFENSLCSGFIITDELLESLYLFSKRNKNIKSSGSFNETEQFLDKAHASLALVHMFMTSVPLKSLGCLIHNDMYWKAEPFSGGEDWFVQYKNAWKKIFEKKWSAWLRDCQIESLKTNLKSNFGIDTFPQLPNRPWAQLWGGQYFKYELSAGFLYWFIIQKFPDYELSLKTVMVEGDFINKENQAEFTDAFNAFIQLSISLQNLQMKCSQNGETGMMLKKLGEEHLRSLNAQTRAEKLIRSVESDFESILHRFGDACRSISQHLGGILRTTKDQRFDSLSNLNTLQGRDNAIFQQSLKKSKNGLDSALNLLKELEILDSKNKRTL